METVLMILAFIVACGIGIAWDYYKPSRFRTSYRNVDNKRNGDAGYSSHDNGDCGGGDGGGD